jgi:hypothetical protein
MGMGSPARRPELESPASGPGPGFIFRPEARKKPEINILFEI